MDSDNSNKESSSKFFLGCSLFGSTFVIFTEALAFKRLLTEFHLKQDEVAERVSKSRTAVTNSMRLLKLCDEVQQMVIDEMISTGHARAILSIEDPEEQYLLAQFQLKNTRCQGIQVPSYLIVH